VEATEVVPGIFRIQSVLGPRPFCQYLLREQRSLLFDTGVKETPAEVIFPALDSIGLDPTALDFAVVSHADVDHFGGNAAVRAAAPRAFLCAHAADVPWIEDSERILRERYGWYAAHGIGYSPESAAWLRDAMGPDTPIDLALTGDETIRLGPSLSVRILHLPGHSDGHVGLWEPRSRTAIVMDAVMGRGLLGLDGSVIHPPPYFDPLAYEASARLLQSLDPARLLTAHYPVMEGAEVKRFLADTIAFVDDVRATTARLLAEAGELTLSELLERADPELGPFSSMPNELGGPLRAHLRELAAAGRAGESPEGTRWRTT
jgi:glyoxylase-like metal-dependent hydrolase (beta-lactamase superfamily II)